MIKTAIRFLTNLIDVVEILGVDKKIVLLSLNSIFPDFEDAIQSNAAETNGLDVIVTRNIKDFLTSGLKVQTPEQFLEEIENF